MNTTQPADFKAFYRSLDAEAKKRFATAAGTTTGNLESHWIHARKIPGPLRMERLYAACAEFGASFNKAELIAFFYETNKDREIKTNGVVDRSASSDDAQPNPGGSVDPEEPEEGV